MGRARKITTCVAFLLIGVIIQNKAAAPQSFTTDQTNAMFDTAVSAYRQKLSRTAMNPSDISDMIEFYGIQLALKYGDHYEFGTAGFPQDYHQAMNWYLKATANAPVCERGLAQAPGWTTEYRIGRLYAEGKGVAPEAVQARTWMQKAACAVPEAQAWLNQSAPHPPVVSVPQLPTPAETDRPRNTTGGSDTISITCESPKEFIDLRIDIAGGHVTGRFVSKTSGGVTELDFLNNRPRQAADGEHVRQFVDASDDIIKFGELEADGRFAGAVTENFVVNRTTGTLSLQNGLFTYACRPGQRGRVF